MSKQEIYLNHAGTSWPKPQTVVHAVQQAMNRPPSQWAEHFDHAREATAAFLGIRDAEQLLLTPGCTSSLAVALGDVEVGGGKRVLTSVWEHHAMHRPLMKLEQQGVPVEYIPPGTDSPIDLDQVEAQLSQGDVGLIALTAAANVTGDLLPFEDVITLAHHYDAQVLLDAAQVVGWLALDFDTLGADLIAFGGHKGLQAPWGIGGLYVADSARMSCSRASSELPQAGQKLRPGYCDVGSVDQVALAGLHAAVVHLSQLDQVRYLAQARDQISQIETALTAAGVRCYYITKPSLRMPTLAFSPHGRSSAELAAALRALGIAVGSGLQCAPLAHQTLATENQGLLRISVGIGQSAAEIQAAIELIRGAIDA